MTGAQAFVLGVTCILSLLNFGAILVLARRMKEVHEYLEPLHGDGEEAPR